ncbi:MAG: hypothetical protein MMC33_010613 [Icmadophila ericetorum]|nr:hypothetical protein [Icmadophila ericetorum]
MTLGTPTERGFYFDLALKSEAFVESCQRPPSQWPEKETRLPLQWEEGNSPKPRSPLWPDPLNPLQYWKIKARNLCELCVFEQCPAHALGHWQSRKVEAEFWYTKCASRSSLEKKQIGPIVDGSINEAEWRQCSLFWKSTWLKRSLGYPQRDEWECIYNTYRAVLAWWTNDERDRNLESASRWLARQQREIEFWHRQAPRGSKVKVQVPDVNDQHPLWQSEAERMAWKDTWLATEPSVTEVIAAEYTSVRERTLEPCDSSDVFDDRLDHHLYIDYRCLVSTSHDRSKKKIRKLRRSARIAKMQPPRRSARLASLLRG